MKKSTVVSILCVILSGIVAVEGTYAFLSEEQSKTNVMTVGSVKIANVELERKEQTNSGDDTLKKFTPNKTMLPAVGEIKWVESDQGRVYQKWPKGGGSALFHTDLKNVVDKFVFVENTGKSEAYVRTWFAFEAGEMTAEDLNNKLVHWNRNSTHWRWTDFSEDMKIQLDGATYYLRVATYVGSDTVHVGGILPSGETTRPSLLQFFFDGDVTNEMIRSFGEDYKIIVFSQACQTAGFFDVDTALNTNFGEIRLENNPWNK